MTKNDFMKLLDREIDSVKGKEDFDTGYKTGLITAKEMLRIVQIKDE